MLAFLPPGSSSATRRNPHSPPPAASGWSVSFLFVPAEGEISIWAPRLRVVNCPPWKRLWQNTSASHASARIGLCLSMVAPARVLHHNAEGALKVRSGQAAERRANFGRPSRGEPPGDGTAPTTISTISSRPPGRSTRWISRAHRIPVQIAPGEHRNHPHPGSGQGRARRGPRWNKTEVWLALERRRSGDSITGWTHPLPHAPDQGGQGQQQSALPQAECPAAPHGPAGPSTDGSALPFVMADAENPQPRHRRAPPRVIRTVSSGWLDETRRTGSVCPPAAAS